MNEIRDMGHWGQSLTNINPSAQNAFAQRAGQISYGRDDIMIILSGMKNRWIIFGYTSLEIQ
jgi:hypothetical protein